MRNESENHVDEALQELRDGIDAIDEELASLLTQRALLCLHILKLKQQQVMTVEVPWREAEILALAKARGDAGPLGGERMRSVFREIVKSCREMQEELSQRE